MSLFLAHILSSLTAPHSIRPVSLRGVCSYGQAGKQLSERELSHVNRGKNIYIYLDRKKATDEKEDIIANPSTTIRWQFEEGTVSLHRIEIFLIESSHIGQLKQYIV